MHLQRSWVSVHPRRWSMNTSYPYQWHFPPDEMPHHLGLGFLFTPMAWEGCRVSNGRVTSQQQAHLLVLLLTTSVNHNAGLGKATGTCSQAQKEDSRKKGKPSHSAAAAQKWRWSSSPVGKGGLVWGPSVRRVRFSCSWFINKVTSMTVVSAICLGALFSISFWTFHAGIWLVVIRLFFFLSYPVKAHYHKMKRLWKYAGNPVMQGS